MKPKADGDAVAQFVLGKPLRELGVCAPERSWDLVVGNCSRPVPQEGSVVGKDVVFYSVLGHLVEFSARYFSCGADS